MFPIAWNILGVRVLRRAILKGASVDLIADVGGFTQRSNVDYRWSANESVLVRRQLYKRAGVFAAGAGHLMVVSPDRARHTQSGGEVEGGMRLVGDAGVTELFVGFERRFDAHQLDSQPRHWFMVGFRLLRQ